MKSPALNDLRQMVLTLQEVGCVRDVYQADVPIVFAKMLRQELVDDGVDLKEVLPGDTLLLEFRDLCKITLQVH